MQEIGGNKKFIVGLKYDQDNFRVKPVDSDVTWRESDIIDICTISGSLYGDDGFEIMVIGSEKYCMVNLQTDVPQYFICQHS